MVIRLSRGHQFICCGPWECSFGHGTEIPWGPGVQTQLCMDGQYIKSLAPSVKASEPHHMTTTTISAGDDVRYPGS